MPINDNAKLNLSQIFSGTAIIKIAKLIYQRWKKVDHPIKKLNAVSPSEQRR